MNTRVAGDIVFLSYTRQDDGTNWKYRCRVDGQRIIWASDPGGRWRTHPEDEQLFFRVVKARIGSQLEVEERYSDGSSTKDTFSFEDLGN
jgi:hypothetical protein